MGKDRARVGRKGRLSDGGEPGPPARRRVRRCAGAARQPRHQPLPGRSGIRAAPRALSRADAPRALAAASRPAGRPGRRHPRRAGRHGRPQPTPTPLPRPVGHRPAMDREAPGLRGDGAHRLRRLRVGRDVAPRGVLGWPRPMPPTAKYALSYLFVQAEFGLCCPREHDRRSARTLASSARPRW